MLNLSTTGKIQLITSSGADIDAHASWVDDVSDAMTPGATDTQITTATTTDNIVPVPSSGVRNVKFMSFRNIDGSTSNDVTVQKNANGTIITLFKCTLLAQEMLVCREGIWFHYDSNGGVYGQTLPSASDTAAGGIQIATQSDMENGSSNTLAVTPGRAQFHPSACKFWVKTSPGNVNNASYNVTSVSDTAAGITVVTIATDFSSANWCCQCACESTSDTMTVTNLKFVRIGLGDQAAGSVSIEVHDATAITAVLEDPTAWHVCGYGDQ